MMSAKYFVTNGFKVTEVEGDGVMLKTEDGTEVELTYRKSDGEISLSINGRLVLWPYATNVIRISRQK